MSRVARPLALPSVRGASFQHVASIADLINGHARKGLMLPRSNGELVTALPDFVVVADETGVLACGGLRHYATGRAEIIGLAVRDHIRGSGVGRAIVETLISRAGCQGVSELFALTLEPGFFRRMGFEAVGFDSVPEKVGRDCVSCPFRAGCQETPVVLTLGWKPGERTWLRSNA